MPDQAKPNTCLDAGANAPTARTPRLTGAEKPVQVWVRNHHDGGWITVPWTHQGLLRQPFADFTWRAARKLLAEQGGDATDETAITGVLAELLARGETGDGPAA